jgi:preprotein translocase subunit SecA
MRANVVRQLMHLQINVEQPPQMLMPVDPDVRLMQAHHLDPLTGEDEFAPPPAADGTAGVRLRRPDPDMAVDPNDPKTWGKVQRNAPCPCGSGRKFKHCHGALV